MPQQGSKVLPSLLCPASEMHMWGSEALAEWSLLDTKSGMR